MMADGKKNHFIFIDKAKQDSIFSINAKTPKLFIFWF